MDNRAGATAGPDAAADSDAADFGPDQTQHADDMWTEAPAELEVRFECIGKIGEGNFGHVFRARNKETGDLAAVKQLSFADEEHDSVPPHVIREVSLLQSFEHPNVVRLLEVHIGETAYFLVFEHADRSLHEVLKGWRRKREQMPMDQVAQYGRQLLEGVHACHIRQVIHRDLKPQNILVTAAGLKICDFGLARMFSPPLRPYSHDVITLWYRAPEILLGANVYGSEVDVWSAGCCLAEMAVGSAIFPGQCEIHTIFLVFGICGTPTEETWPGISKLENFKPTFPAWPPTELQHLTQARPELEGQGIDLLQGMLCMCPAKRLTARRAKGHVFFADSGA